MKKNHCLMVFILSQVWRHKLSFIMRLTFAICIFCVLQSFAIGSYSQNSRLSIDQKNITIENLLQIIEAKTDYHFMYSRIVVDVDKTIDIQVKDKLVSEILNDIFRNTDISYKIDGRLIGLSKMEDLTPSIQQIKKIEGQTKDKSGAPLPGVTVIIKSTTIGTVTDNNGHFSFENIPNDATLVFSFIGMKTQEILVKGQSKVNVIMEDENVNVDEVVVVGYGVQRKEDATGSVQRVSTDDFNKGVVSSPAQLLSGKVAGLSISSVGGEPGGQMNVRLRGGTSINAGNEPLFVIDDVPIDNSAHNPGGFSAGRNPLNSINPSDIEDITVLKDASATAIYGSRGANGVIIIRTKRGKIGQKGVQSVDYNGYVSFASIAKKYDVLSAAEYRETLMEFAPSRENYIGNANTDWQNEIFRDAISHTHDLSISGGAEKMSYRVSLGYQNQEGIIRRSSSERTSAALAFNQNLFDDMLEVSGNFRIAKTEDLFANAGALGSALQFNPTQPVKSGDDSLYGGYFEFEGQMTPSNPVALIEQNQDDASGKRNLGNIEFKYKLHFFPKVSLKANLAYDLSDGIRRSYIPVAAKGNQQAGTANGEIRKESYFRNSNLLETYIDYNDQFESINSKVSAMFGYSYQDFVNEFSSFRATELGSDILGYNSTAGASSFEAATSKQGNKLISFFGRFNYNLADRYLVTFTLRQDGSSRFSKSNRWGSFPSASFAWRITEEQFMKNLGIGTVLSNLKFRAGWGVTGNQEIGNYQYMPTYTLGDSKSAIQFGDSFISTLRPNGVDKDLKWEETSQINMGLDFGLFDNRINGAIDLYKKDTKDLLFTVAVPQPFLNTKVLTNIGQVRNRGVEFSLDSYIISTKKVEWNLAVNLAYNQNKIIKLDNNNDPTFPGYEVGSISGGTGNNIQILKEGESVNSFYVFEHIMENGKPIYKDMNGDGSINAQDIYKDQNNDKIIDDKDKIIKGSANPDITYGLSSMLRAYGFDLNVSVKASTGNYVYNNVASNNSLKFIISEPTPNNILKSSKEIEFLENEFFSSYFVEKASFIRVDNITLGYSFKLPKTNIKTRFYCTGQNLLLISGYSGLDPEVVNTAVVNSNTIQQIGIDNNLYPRSKAVIFGVNINF